MQCGRDYEVSDSTQKTERIWDNEKEKKTQLHDANSTSQQTKAIEGKSHQCWRKFQPAFGNQICPFFQTKCLTIAQMF